MNGSGSGGSGPTDSNLNPDDHYQHLMLRIEGRGNTPDKVTQRREDEGMEDMIERFQARLAEIRHLMVDLDVDEREHEDEQRLEVETNVEGRLFGGAEVGGGGVALGGSGEGSYRATGFGNAVLDEQD